MNLTNYGENRFADELRGIALPVPASWAIAPLSAADEAAQVEITGTNIARFAIAGALASWMDTQGAGTGVVSTGTSKITSNMVGLDMGIATGAIGTCTHVGFFDSYAGGNCWAYAELATPIVTAADVALLIAAGDLALSFGVAGGATNYLVNKWLDKLLRGQAWSYPSSMWLAEMLAGGGEVGGGVGYARIELPCTTDDLSGTQAPGSTTASSGSSGRISNNNLLAFPDPTGPHGDVDRLGVYDDPTLGNQLWLKALIATKTIGVGRALALQPGKVGFTFA